MSLKQLPDEVLDIIFRLVILNSRDRQYVLSKCALVCRAWHPTACRILYESIHIANTRTILPCLVIQRTNVGFFCKKLTLASTYRSKRKRGDNLEELFRYLPNIETIELEHGWFRRDHLRIIAKHSNLLKRVKNIARYGMMWENKEMQHYYNCANAFRDTLSRMSLSSVGTKISGVDRRSGNIISFLPDFTALTSLEIRNRDSVGRDRFTRLSMFAVLRSCPNLIDFVIETDCQETVPERDESNLSIDHSKLRFLDITIPELTRYHINYLISNVTGLRRIKLQSGYDYLHSTNYIATIPSADRIEWMDKIGPDYSDRFQKYLRNIDLVDFCIGRYLNPKLGNYLPFINGFIGEKSSSPVDLELKFDDFNILTCVELKQREGRVCFSGGVTVDSQTEINALTSTIMESLIPSCLKYNQVESFDVTSYLGMDTNADRYDDKLLLTAYFTIFEWAKNRFTNLKKFRMRANYNPFKEIKMSLHDKDRNIIAYMGVYGCKLDRDKDNNTILNLGNLNIQRLRTDTTTLIQENKMGGRIVIIKIEEEDSNEISYQKLYIEEEISKARFVSSDRPYGIKAENFIVGDAEFLANEGRSSSPRIDVLIIKCGSLKQIEIGKDYGNADDSVFL